MDRAVVNFAGKNETHGVSMSRHPLVWIDVYSESTMRLFDSRATVNLMSHKMVKKLHIRMQPTNSSTKVANRASERCAGTLKQVPINMDS